MKLGEFNALCGREWAKPKRGDVVSICLTGPSAAELCADVLINGTPGGHLLLFDKKEEAAIRAGALITDVVNPITRTVVKIRTKAAGSRETARVSVIGGTYRQTWWPASA